MMMDEEICSCDEGLGVLHRHYYEMKNETYKDATITSTRRVPTLSKWVRIHVNWRKVGLELMKLK